MPSAAFNQAVKESKQLTQKPSQDELLTLYALFKQAQEDFSKATKPGTFDFKAKYKYQAWEKVVKEGKTPEQAEKDYVTFVNELKDRLGFDSNKVPENVGA